MSFVAQLNWAGAAFTVLWLLGLGAALLLTRNGTVRPQPASQELGPQPESPAVVSLIGSGWRSVRHAAAATLLDLAARGALELRQPGNDPAQSTIHLTNRQLPQLTPYEQRVLARVAERAGSAGAPIGAMAFRGEKSANTWNSALRREIVAEARLRGLSRPRLRTPLVNTMLLTSLLPGALFGLAVVVGGHGVRAAVFVGGAPVVALCALLVRFGLVERSTEAGLVRAGHWAGLHSWLRAHEEFAQLPPASVALWDRYLAYGTALGVSSRTSRLLGFDDGDRRRVWSDFGGRWRQVRVRYPLLWPGYGATGRRLLRTAAATAVIAVGLLAFVALRSADWAATGLDDPGYAWRRPGVVLAGGWLALLLLALAVAGRFTRLTFFLSLLGFVALYARSIHGGFAHPLASGSPLLGEGVAIAVFGAATLGYLALFLLDRRRPVTVIGEVLRLESKLGKKAPRFLALDEGRGDRTVAWALPRGTAGYLPGSRVRLSVCRATRTVRSIEPANHGS
ncbi:DUF2207 family protein [Kitasatospora azatica]|uniref:DUF2207 family protein n=1 Tax=Kitasatospora azatica TaxID=58347 RepID=UPI00055AF55A|nr:DUF2207 domain-containing protein [Kitasatospora azatica]